MYNKIEARHPIPPAPIHPLAALVTVVLDNIFGAFEILDPFMIVVTSFTVGTIGTVATMLVQHYLAKDEWGPSIAKGLVMGIIAGVPFPVTGTVVGVPLLAWSGLHKWVKLPPIASQPAATDPDVVDAEYKDVD